MHKLCYSGFTGRCNNLFLPWKKGCHCRIYSKLLNLRGKKKSFVFLFDSEIIKSLQRQLNLELLYSSSVSVDNTLNCIIDNWISSEA